MLDRNSFLGKFVFMNGGCSAELSSKDGNFSLFGGKKVKFSFRMNFQSFRLEGLVEVVFKAFVGEAKI